MMKKVLLCIILTSFIPTLAFGKERKSGLGAHFKPFIQGVPLYWSAELMLAAGTMNNSLLDRDYINRNFYVRIDLNVGHHQLYVEVGLKKFYKSDTGPGLGVQNPGWGDYPKPEKHNSGLREAFYRYEGSDAVIAIGLSSMELGSSMLIDERAIGIKAEKAFSAFRIDVSAASVMNDFAREGDFCSTRHVRRLLRGGRLGFNSSDLGFSNFAAGVLRWNPNYEKHQKIESVDDDSDSFSDDFLQFSSFKMKKIPLLDFRFYQLSGVWQDFPFDWNDTGHPDKGVST